MFEGGASGTSTRSHATRRVMFFATTFDETLLDSNSRPTHACGETRNCIGEVPAQSVSSLFYAAHFRTAGGVTIMRGNSIVLGQSFLLCCTRNLL